jgi:hypothetical protein
MPYLDTLLGIAGLGASVFAIGVSVFAILDNRRQRKEREKAVIAAHAVIERIYGLLIGIKPAIIPTLPGLEAAINDGLAVINQQRTRIDAL